MAALGFSDQYYFTENKICEISGSETTDFEISVYEIFKVISGVPLFFADHMERLVNSLKLAALHDYEVEQKKIRLQIVELCKRNNKFFGNIELRISKPKEGASISLLGFVAHNYPNPLTYIEGVKIDILQAERNNPRAKIKHTKTRLRANEYIKENNVFEVLLENNQGEITEGSRSNVFFIKDKTIYTTPLKLVLPGITRKYAIQAIKNLKFNVLNQLVTRNSLMNYDAAFLCGTSIGILPISTIGKISFDSRNAVLREIMQEFNSLVSGSLTSE